MNVSNPDELEGDPVWEGEAGEHAPPPCYHLNIRVKDPYSPHKKIGGILDLDSTLHKNRIRCFPNTAKMS